MFEYYSQYGADKYLNEKYFWTYNSGVFVDIGAHDGVTGSNTLYFEKQGWKGICFEPMPKAFLKLSQTRSCELSNKAISDFKGEATFVEIEGYSEQLSGLKDNYSLEHAERVSREVIAHNQKINNIEVEVGLFNEEVANYSKIELLTVDTEGSESKIIKSINFDFFFIKFMIIEFNHQDNDLIQFLDSKGFKPEVSLGVDVIFKNSICY